MYLQSDCVGRGLPPESRGHPQADVLWWWLWLGALSALGYVWDDTNSQASARERRKKKLRGTKGKRARLGLCFFALFAFFSSFALVGLIPRAACNLQAPFDPASCIALQPDDADEVWEPCDLRGVLQFMTNAHTRSQPSSAHHVNPIHATRLHAPCRTNAAAGRQPGPSDAEARSSGGSPHPHRKHWHRPATVW